MKFYKSLRFRLILLVLISVIPALGVTLYSGMEQRRLARLNAEADVYQLTALLSSYHANLIENGRQFLESLALNPEIADSAACSAYLQQINPIYPLYASISVANTAGEVYCTSRPGQQAINIADRTYFQQALKTGQFVIGATVTDRFSKRLVVPLALPVANQQGQTSLVLVATLDLRQILNFITTMKLPSLSASLIIDQNGTILLRYPESEKWTGQNFAEAPVIQKILSSQTVGSAQVPGVDGIPRLYAFTPLQAGSGSNLYVSIGMPVDIVYASAEKSLLINLAWIGLAALLALVFAWYGGEVFFLRLVSLTAERDAAERQLKEANTRLEERVAQRTAELKNTNQTLSIELTERKRTEKALRRSEEELRKLLVQLERSNRDLQDFAYVASHDLQEPLRKIQAFGERLVKAHAAQLDQEGLEYTNRMTAAAKRMQAMINDLLTYSRVTTQGKAFMRVNLNDIAEEVVSDLEIRIRDTHGQIILGSLPTLEADPLQMHQLLQNLIGNALKFHRPDLPPVVKVNGEIIPGAEDPENCQAVLQICDNGIGFDEKYLDRIFQPFQRLHGRSEYEGSGIGLAICRKIVERHNGSITATSHMKSGSCFIVTLPVNQPNEERES